jgi:chemotaxis signal transduction protein
MLDLIIFEVDKRSLSVLAAEVIEIVRVVAVTELAGCEAPFVGVINYRGTVVPVARLNPDTSPRPSDHMLIMGKDGDASICLVVDRVLAFTTADEILALVEVNKGGFQSLKLTPE